VTIPITDELIVEIKNDIARGMRSGGNCIPALIARVEADGVEIKRLRMLLGKCTDAMK